MCAGRFDSELNAVSGRVRELMSALPADINPASLEDLRRVKAALVELEDKADNMRQVGPLCCAVLCMLWALCGVPYCACGVLCGMLYGLCGVLCALITCFVRCPAARCWRSSWTMRTR